MNAGLRAQAGGPLGLSWGLSVLNLFWKQRKKTRELLWGGQKGLGSKIHTSGDSGIALESPSMPCPPQTLPPTQCRHLRLEPASLKPWEWNTFIGRMPGAYQGSSLRKPFMVDTGLTLSFTICGFLETRKDDTSQH